MFAPHLTIISGKRCEPDNFDVETETQKINDMFSKLAEKIVSKDIMTKEPDKKRVKKSIKKVKKAIEKEERLRTIKPFMSLWNHWREFYYNLPPLEPKTSSQIGAIENSIAYCNEHEYNLSIMIACVHRSCLKRTVRPAFTSIVSYGADAYKKYFDDVEADIDKEEYTYGASR